MRCGDGGRFCCVGDVVGECFSVSSGGGEVVIERGCCWVFKLEFEVDVGGGDEAFSFRDEG